MAESEGPDKGDKRGAYKWRDAWPGNELALRHGANSERKVQPVADQLGTRLVEVRPDLADESYGPAVKAWARAERRVWSC